MDTECPVRLPMMYQAKSAATAAIVTTNIACGKEKSGAGQSAHGEQDRNRWDGNARLLRHDPQSQNQVSVLSKKSRTWCMLP